MDLLSWSWIWIGAIYGEVILSNMTPGDRKQGEKLDGCQDLLTGRSWNGGLNKSDTLKG